ncbi:MAG: transglycosylase domain-containing protein [Lentilitoribacter sp.]
MGKALNGIGLTGLALIVGIFGYGGKGWYDAVQMSDAFVAKAEQLSSSGRGVESLTSQQLETLIKVQDPGFYDHDGIDFSSKGAGLTTLTQSLAKRLGFEKFTPGIGKIRQSGFALGLDSVLSKHQQVALFLDTAEMGKGPDGWITGFHKAAEIIYQKPVAKLDENEFNALVAVLIAPAQLKLSAPDAALEERVARITKLAHKECEPNNFNDVWLEGCA